MSWKNDQYLPTPEIVEAVINMAVIPAISNACDQLCIPDTSTYFEVWVAGKCELKLPVSAIKSKNNEIGGSGCTRLRFRRTIQDARSLFFAQVKLDDPDMKSGLSGFIIRGEVKTNSGTSAISTRSCTAIYNRSSWIDPASL